MGVHIRPRVLDLAGVGENRWHDLEELAHQLEQLVVGEMLLGEFSLTHVPRVSLPQDCMTVPWDHLPTLEGLYHEVLEVVLGVIIPERFPEFHEPDQDLLVRETVKWAGQSAHSGRKGEIGVGEG